MTERSTTHDVMTIEREYAATPERVFGAWTSAEAKRIWMFGAAAEEDGFSSHEYVLEFHVGGKEFIRGEGGGDIYTYDARYEDIVENQRIVYTSYMLRGDVRISVSATSVEFEAVGDTTKLTLVEHGIYLDGHDRPEQRFEGISAQLDALAPYLAKNGS